MTQRPRSEQPYSFWRSLFCKHEWKKIRNLVWYNNAKDLKNKLPNKEFRRWECAKCLKLKEQQIM